MGHPDIAEYCQESVFEYVFDILLSVHRWTARNAGDEFRHGFGESGLKIISSESAEEGLFKTEACGISLGTSHTSVTADHP